MATESAGPGTSVAEKEKLLFNKLDKQKRGYLDGADLRLGLRGMNLSIGVDTLRLLVESCGAPTDRIEFPHFRLVIKRLSEARSRWRRADAASGGTGEATVDGLLAAYQDGASQWKQPHITVLVSCFSRSLTLQFHEFFEFDLFAAALLTQFSCIKNSTSTSLGSSWVTSLFGSTLRPLDELELAEEMETRRSRLTFDHFVALVARKKRTLNSALPPSQSSTPGPTPPPSSASLPSASFAGGASASAAPSRFLEPPRTFDPASMGDDAGAAPSSDTSDQRLGSRSGPTSPLRSASPLRDYSRSRSSSSSSSSSSSAAAAAAPGPSSSIDDRPPTDSRLSYQMPADPAAALAALASAMRNDHNAAAVASTNMSPINRSRSGSVGGRPSARIEPPTGFLRRPGLSQSPARASGGLGDSSNFYQPAPVVTDQTQATQWDNGASNIRNSGLLGSSAAFYEPAPLLQPSSADSADPAARSSKSLPRPPVSQPLLGRGGSAIAGSSPLTRAPTADVSPGPADLLSIPGQRRSWADVRSSQDLSVTLTVPDSATSGGAAAAGGPGPAAWTRPAFLDVQLKQSVVGVDMGVFCLRANDACVYAGSSNGQVLILDRATGALQRKLQAHPAGRIFSIEILHNRYMWTAGEDKMVQVMELPQLTRLMQAFDHSASVHALTSHVEADLVLTGDVSGRLVVWQASTRTSLRMLELSQPIFCLRCCGPELWVGTFRVIFAVDLVSHQVVAEWEAYERPINAILAVGNSVWTASMEGRVKVWQRELTSNGQLQFRLTSEPESRSRLLTAVPNDPRHVIGTTDSHLFVWNTETVQTEYSVDTNHPEPIVTVALSDADVLWSTSLDGGMMTWKLTPVAYRPKNVKKSKLARGGSTMLVSVSTKEWAVSAERSVGWKDAIQRMMSCPQAKMIEAPRDHIEYGDISLASLPEDAPLEDGERFFPYFAAGLYHRPHTHLLCTSTETGPVIVSMEDEPSPADDGGSSASGDEPVIKAMVRTRKEDKRVLLPARRPTESLFVLHPELLPHNMWRVPRGPLSDDLVAFERDLIPTSYKFGVLLQKAGQLDEVEWYNNRETTPALTEFLDFLASKVELQGWARFRGGLNVTNNSTGTHSYYTTHQGFEVMFHVATMIPFYELDAQQVERKRHLGNDIIVVLFREPGCDVPFELAKVKSQFNKVFIVVEPDMETSAKTGTTHYRIAVAAQIDVPGFGPGLPFAKSFPKSERLRDWLLTKCINGERASMYSADFRGKTTFTRKNMLAALVDRNPRPVPKKLGDRARDFSPFARQRKEKGK